VSVNEIIKANHFFVKDALSPGQYELDQLSPVFSQKSLRIWVFLDSKLSLTMQRN